HAISGPAAGRCCLASSHQCLNVCPQRQTSRNFVLRSLFCNGCHCRLRETHQVGRRQFDLKTTLAAAEENSLPPHGCPIDEGPQPLLLSQRADSSQKITGSSLGELFIRHVGFLSGSRLCQGLQVQQPRDRHHS